MITDDVTTRIKAIVTEHLNVDQDKVTSEAKFIDDLGCDSLDLIELVMAAEEEFGIEISDADAETMISVGDAIAYIEKRLRN